MTSYFSTEFNPVNSSQKQVYYRHLQHYSLTEGNTSDTFGVNMVFSEKPIKGQITRHQLKMIMIANTKICNSTNLIGLKLEHRPPSSTKRLRRHVGIFQYWLRGGGLGPANLNREISKLHNLEEAHLEELRRQVMTKASGHMLVNHMKKINEQLSNRICHESVKNRAELLSYHLNELLRDTLDDIRDDVEMCMSGGLPPTISTPQLTRLCRAANYDSHACSNLNILRKLFTCKLLSYAVDNNGMSQIIVKIKLHIFQS